MTEQSAVRTTGAESVTWDLSIFYTAPDDPAISADMTAIAARIDDFAARYRGRVAGLGASELAEAVAELESIVEHVYRVGSFAHLLYDEDTANETYGALRQRVLEWSSTLEQKWLFFDLEWLAVEDARAADLLADPALEKYRHYLEAERRYKPYKLSEAEEKLLVEKSVTGSSAWGRFFDQLTAAMRYDFRGEQVTQEVILSKLYDSDRAVRQVAADAVTTTLKSRAMELTYVMNTLLADKSSNDRLRGFPSWVSSRNLANKAPDAVVEALITAVTSNYEIVARHYRLKRALLGLDELTEYDRYAPLPLKEGDAFYTWGQAQDIVLNAYRAFSPQMADIAARFFDERWIHAALLPNKSSGAYSASTVPSAHPFILTNYNGQARDVSTLAHELGHGIHQYLSNQQGLINADTPLTTAEMASTFGEMLVFNDLMGREPDAQARLAMLANKIEDSFATIFRQVAMNRFEDGAHTARRAEGELATARLNQIWLETQRAMFGDSVNLRDDYGIWWSYIPHFIHVPGYVYAYAFGELLVLALYNIYQTRGADFVPAYVDVLAAGGSDYPDRILARVGVDLGDPNFWNEGLAALGALVDQEEKLARSVFPEKFA